MSDSKVIEFAGKFIASINGKITTFETKGEADAAVVMEENSESILARAAAFCAAAGLEGKNAAGKTKVITDFLCFEAGLEAEEETPDAE